MSSRTGGLVAGIALAALATALMVVSTAAAVPRSFFGVAPQRPLTDEDFERMGQAKVGTVRFEISWAGVDPGPESGDLQWDGVDSVVRRAAENGVNALPFIYSTPPWIAELDDQSCSGASCVTYAPKSGEALDAWGDFVGAAVRRYGADGQFWDQNPDVPRRPIRTWQLWNEQNSPSFFKPRPNVKAFAKLLDAGSRAVRSADRRAEVVLGGMFGTPLGGRKPGIDSWKYLERLYRVKGAKQDFDAVSAHPYASKLDKVKIQVQLLRDEMIAAKDRRAHMLITELGWASAGPPNPLNRGRKGQARKLTQTFRHFRKRRGELNLDTVIWYSWRDNPDADVGLCPWCPFTGLVDSELEEKPSLGAFTDLTGGS